MEFLFGNNGILSNTSVIITIVTIMVIAFARSVTKIFKMGVTFKADLATKTEQREFEAEIRRYMRGYAVQIQKSVQVSVMLTVNNRLKDIEDAKQAATDIQITKAEIEMQLKNLREKTASIKDIEDSVRQMNTRLQRLEYSTNTPNLSKTDRRTE